MGPPVSSPRRIPNQNQTQSQTQSQNTIINPTNYTRRTSVDRNSIKNSNPLAGLPSGFSNGNYRQYSLNDFEVGKKLGKGKFGKVYCVRDKQTGYVCALKAMEKKELIEYKIEKQFRREVEIQSNLR